MKLTMIAATIKHRKHNATYASQRHKENECIHAPDEIGKCSLDSNPSLGDDRKTNRERYFSWDTSNYARCNGTLVLMAATAFISTIILFIRLKIPSFSLSEHTDEIGIPPPELPFLDLKTKISPLTGTYSLGKQFLLQTSSAFEHTSNNLPTGTIHFPYADLSSLLKEEALEPTFHPRLPNQFHGQSNPTTSYLEDSASFNSVINIKGIFDYAILTRRGFKMGKIPNQDRSFIVDFTIDMNMGNENHPYNAIMMGIFDGHGPQGHEVAHFLALELPDIFAQCIRQHNTYEGIRNSTAHERYVTNSIKNSFHETFMTADAKEPSMIDGGSTASVLFYPGFNSKVYIANVGDSTTLIVSHCKTNRTSTVVYQNRKHKPHLLDERQRIENAGGIVKIPLSLIEGEDGGINGGIQESSRVIIPDKNGNPFRSMALAMSRSIGDIEGKRIGLTAEPEIDVWDMDDWKRQNMDQVNDTVIFAITASDGLFDVLSTERVASYLGQALVNDRRHDSDGLQVSPLEACERLVREASRLWMIESIGLPYRDDISIAVRRINFIS